MWGVVHFIWIPQTRGSMELEGNENENQILNSPQSTFLKLPSNNMHPFLLSDKVNL